MRLCEGQIQLGPVAAERQGQALHAEEESQHRGDLPHGCVLVGERRRQERAVVRVTRLGERLDPRRQHRSADPVVRQEPAHPPQDLRRPVDAALGGQHLQGADAELVGEAAAAQMQHGVLDGSEYLRRGGVRGVGGAAQALLQDLLDADALVTELDERPLVCAQRKVPGLLRRLLAELPLTHDRPRGTVRHQVAQHPQHIGALPQFRLGGHVQQSPPDAALLELEAEWGEAVVHVPGEGRQRVVADLADPVAAHQDLHEAAHIAPARHGLLLDAGDRRVLEVVRGGPGPVPHAGQQDRRLEHGDLSLIHIVRPRPAGRGPAGSAGSRRACRRVLPVPRGRPPLRPSPVSPPSSRPPDPRAGRAAPWCA